VLSTLTVSNVTAAQFGAPQQAAFIATLAAALDVNAGMVFITSITEAASRRRRLLGQPSISVGVRISRNNTADAALTSMALQAAVTTPQFLQALQVAALPTAVSVSLVSAPQVAAPPPPPATRQSVASVLLLGYTLSYFGAPERAMLTAAAEGLVGAPAGSLSAGAARPQGLESVNVTLTAPGNIAQAARATLLATSSDALTATLLAAGLAQLVRAQAGPPAHSLAHFAFHGGAAPTPPDPFVCAPPYVRLVANASHTIFLVNHGSARGDFGGDAPSGRTPFTFATFVRAMANAPLPWAMPEVNPRLGAAFDAYAATDPRLYKGMCSPAAAAVLPYSAGPYWDGTPGYPFVSNLTQQTPGAIAPDATTPNLVGVTPQAAGCACAALQLAQDVATPTSGCGDSTVGSFYTSPAEPAGGWALRQFMNFSDAECPLRTEATLLVPSSQLDAFPGVTVTRGAGSTKLVLELFTVEVGSTTRWSPAAPRVDAFLTRVSRHALSVERLTAGALMTAQTQQSQPLLVSLASATAALNAASVNVTVSALAYAPDASLSFAAAPTLQLPAGYGATCESLVAAAAGAQPTHGHYACADASCATVSPASIPAAVGATSGRWRVYALTASCAVTTPSSVGPGWSLPPAQLVLAYALTAEGGEQLTDARSPPTVALSFSARVNELQQTSLNFTLAGAVLDLKEDSIAAAASLTEMVLANSANVVSGSTPVEYDGAVAFTAHLAGAPPEDWQLSSMLSILVATPFDTPGSEWCGLDVALAVLAVRGDTPPSAWPVQAKSQISPNALLLLQDAYDNAALSNASVLQGDLWADNSAPALVPDGAGGFALPLRNRLVANAVPADEFLLSMCAVTSISPTAALQLGGYYPLYTTAAAARAANSDGSSPLAVRLNGALYFLAGSSPTVCAPASAAVPGALPPGSPGCGPVGSRRRRALLQSMQSPSHVTLLRSPSLTFGPGPAVMESRSALVVQPTAAQASVVVTSSDTSTHVGGSSLSMWVIVGLVLLVLCIVLIALVAYFNSERRHSRRTKGHGPRVGTRMGGLSMHRVTKIRL
jgi:hypothetical protein